MKAECTESVDGHMGRKYIKGVVYDVLWNKSFLHGKRWHSIEPDVDTWSGTGQVTTEFFEKHFKEVVS